MNSVLNTFPLLAIFWLLITALIIFLIRLFRIKFSYYWLLSTFAILVAWVLVLLSRSGLPYIQEPTNTLPFAETLGFPSLLVDGISWPFALVAVTLSVVGYLTFVMDSAQMDWLSLGGGLALTAFALLAIQSRDIVTIQSGWAAIDILEFLLLFLHLQNPRRIPYIIGAFGLRFIGIVLFLWGTTNTTVLLIAASLRIFVIPAGFLVDENINLPRSVVNFLTFISPLSSFIVFGRIASSIMTSAMNLYIFILLLIIGLISSIAWFTASNEYKGRGYWVLTLSSFVALAAMRGMLIASIMWGIAMILSGVVLFLSDITNKKPFYCYIGALAITSIPFVPTWDGASLYTAKLGFSITLLILIQALLVAGYIKHLATDRIQQTSAERWILLINPLRLIIIVCVYWLIAFLFWRDGVLLRNSMPWLLHKNSIDYFIGFIVGGAGLGIYWLWRIRERIPGWKKLYRFPSITFDWIYKGGIMLYQLFGSMIDGASTIIEGESGILFTLLLLALLITFFMQGR